MSVKERISLVPIVRHCAIKALKLSQRDISITNKWTGDRFRLNSYHHKGYWYFGRDRSGPSMRMFGKLVREGDTVIEAGGHIGFVTQYFSKLVGSRGKVVVFEPGSNNTPYIERNLQALQNATLEKIAVSSKDGTIVLYEDNVTGQNNSLLSTYDCADFVAKMNGETLVRTPREVEVVTLDSYVAKHGLTPDFMKIVVEGSERDVLQGGAQTLRRIRGLMVQVTYHHEDVARILLNHGFKLFNDQGVPQDSITANGNIFALKDAVKRN
jgi:FkbM family methyltransferase